MTTTQPSLKRRHFLTGTMSASLVLSNPAALIAQRPAGMSIIGPRPGYSPEIGTLVSMMAWTRGAVLHAVEHMTSADLDHLQDEKANTIGALLAHLAATDALYFHNTFEDGNWDDPATQKKWGVPMDLGAPARKEIKGHDLPYYTGLLNETREKTLAEFRKRDDKWLMAVDQKWPWGPTNNYCKWFHVCEHESHHQGQIAYLKSRLPGAKVENG